MEREEGKVEHSANAESPICATEGSVTTRRRQTAMSLQSSNHILRLCVHVPDVYGMHINVRNFLLNKRS